MRNKLAYIYFVSALFVSASIAGILVLSLRNKILGLNYTIPNIESNKTAEVQPPPKAKTEADVIHIAGTTKPLQETLKKTKHGVYDIPDFNEREEMVQILKERRVQSSSPDCDAGYIEYIDGEKFCCRGYRYDSEGWIGYSGVNCCPEGTSVNGYGQCIACGKGKYYNMGYADLQNKTEGTQACGLRCATNEDCPLDSFCYMDAHATEANSKIDPIVGTCVTPNDVGGIVAGEVMIDGQSAGYWIGPKNHMDWWSARNFCLRYARQDLPTRRQICGHEVEPGQSCASPLRIALEGIMGSQQQASQFWLEATDSGKAYYVDPLGWGYIVKIPPESTARARSNGVVCGPVDGEIISTY